MSSADVMDGTGAAGSGHLPSWFPAHGTLNCGRAIAGLTVVDVVDTPSTVTMVKGSPMPLSDGDGMRFVKEHVVVMAVCG